MIQAGYEITMLLPVPGWLPRVIEVRGVRHNILVDVDVDVPLGERWSWQAFPVREKRRWPSAPSSPRACSGFWRG